MLVINEALMRNPTEETKLSGAGVSQSEQVNRPKLGKTLDQVREAAENSLDNEQTEQVIFYPIVLKPKLSEN